MTRLKLTVSYVGTAFHGWQTQATPGRHLRTVQETLEQAIGQIAGCAVHVHGAGRTDAGVHADAQTAHVDVPAPKAAFNWRRALNGLLPTDVSVLEALPAPPGFHAQRDARRKLYTYRLWLPREYVLPRWRPFVWACGPLDLAAMEAGAAQMVGERDFSPFRNRGTPVESTVRRLYAVRRVAEPGFCSGELCAWEFEGNGFLKQMVRNLMGLLVAIGRGKLPPEAVAAAFCAQSRADQPGATAPAHGLTLTRVMYDGAGAFQSACG